MLRSTLLKKEQMVDRQRITQNKETTKIIRDERAFASSKLATAIKRHKDAMEQECIVNMMTIARILKQHVTETEKERTVNEAIIAHKDSRLSPLVNQLKEISISSEAKVKGMSQRHKASMEQQCSSNQCAITKKDSKIENLTTAYAKSKLKSKRLAKKTNKSEKLNGLVKRLRRFHKASIIKLRVEKESEQEELLSSHRASMREMKMEYDNQVRELRSDHTTRVQNLKTHYSKRELLMVTKM